MKNKEDDKSIKKAADSHMIISWFSLMKALLTFTSIFFHRNGSIEDQLQLTRNKSVKQTFCKITKSLSHLIFCWISINRKVAHSLKLKLVINFRSTNWFVSGRFDYRQRMWVDVGQKSTRHFVNIFRVTVLKPMNKGLFYNRKSIITWSMKDKLTIVHRGELRQTLDLKPNEYRLLVFPYK